MTECQYNIYDNYNVWAGASLTSFKTVIIHPPQGLVSVHACVCVYASK